MSGELARSIGADPARVTVEVYQAGAWHRRVRLESFGWWVPEGCTRDVAVLVTRTRPEPPGGGLMCPACWPVWPATR